MHDQLRKILKVKAERQSNLLEETNKMLLKQPLLETAAARLLGCIPTYPIYPEANLSS
jgi:hypothetical protein